MQRTDEALTLKKIKQELSEAGFALPHFYNCLDRAETRDVTKDDLQEVLYELEDIQSGLQYRYSGVEYWQKAILVTEKMQEIKAALGHCFNLDDVEGYIIV